MPTPFEVKSAIDDLLVKRPDLQGYSDDVLYEYVKEDNPDIVWADKDKRKKSRYKTNTSPSFMNTFQSWADGPIAESGMFSANWMKEGYNRSLTGLAEQMLTGTDKPRYDLDAYELNVLEDIGATALSFMMPLDLLAMFAGGLAGKAAFTVTGIAKRAGTEFGKKAMHKIVPTMLGQMGSLSVYEGAIGGVQAKINNEDVMSGIVHGVWHGGLVGAGAGLVGGGLAYRNAKVLSRLTGEGKIAKLGDEATEMLTMGDRLAKARTGIAGQIMGESGVFSFAEQVEKVHAGEDFRLDEALTSYVKTLALFGVMKGKHALINKGKKHIAMLEEYEKLSNDPLDPRKSNNSKAFGNIQETLIELANKAKTPAEKEQFLEMAKEARAEELKIDSKHFDSKKELNRIRDVIDEIKTIGEKPTTKQVARIINGLNGIVGVQETLLKKGTGKGEIYESLRGEVKETQKDFMRLLDTLKDPFSKEVVRPWGIKKIVKQNIEIDPVTGEKTETFDFKEEGIDLTTTEGRGEATKLLKIERREAAELKGIELGRDKGLEQYKDAATLAAEMSQTTENIRISSKEKGFRYKKATELEQTILDFDKPSEQAYHIPEIKHETTKNALLAWVGVGGEGTKSNVRLIAKGLEFLKKSNIEKVKANDVKKILQGIEAGKIKGIKRPENMATAFSEFVDWAGYNKLIEQPFRKADLRAKGVWRLADQMRETIASKRKDYLGELDLRGDIEKTIKKLPKYKESTTEQKEMHLSSEFHGEDGLGIRTAELNTLQVNDIKTTKIDGKTKYFYHVRPGAVVKGGGNPRKVEISKDMYDNIQRLIKEKGLKGEDKIFSKESTSKLLEDYVYDERVTVEDSRKYIESRADQIGMTSRQQDFMSYFLGHKGSKGTAGKYYKGTMSEKAQVELSGILKNILKENISVGEGSKQISKLFGTKEIKYQLETTASEMGLRFGELESQKKHFKEVLPQIEVLLRDTLGKFQGENVLGRITGKLVEIAGDRAKADTLPHEISHHVVDILRQFGDARSKELIRRGESKEFFGSEEKLVQAIGEYAAGRMRNKTMIQRSKTWVQEFWSNMRTKLGWYTPEDITRTIGAKVVKGKVPIGEINNLIIKHQTSGPTKNGINGFINTGGKNSLKENVRRKAFNDYKRALVDIFGTTDLKGYMHNASVGQMLKFRDFLVNHPSNGGKSKYSTPVKIEDVNDKYNIEPSVSREVLKDMGVRDGEYGNASPETAKQYESLIRNNNKLPQAKETSFDYNRQLERNKTTLPSAYARSVMPVWLVLKNHGGEPGRKIADRLLNHETAEHVLYRGEGDHVIRLIKKTLRNKHKYIGLWDAQRTEARLKIKDVKDGGLTREERNFLKETEREGSDANIAHKAWRSYSDNMWKTLKDELSRHVSPQKAEKMLKDIDQTYVEGYMTRRLSKDAMKWITENKNFVTDLVDRTIKEGAAKREAKKTMEGKSPERIEEEARRLVKDNDFKEKVRTELYSAIMYGFGSVKSPHLIPRKELLPEYINVTKPIQGTLKRIKTYDDTIGATAETYVKRMSKFLATTKYFPEWTGFGQKYKIGENRRDIMEAMEKHATLGGYAVKSIKRQIGLDKNQFEGLSAPMYKIGATLTHLSAAAGLSSPLSGIKNTLIGIPRSIGDFGFMNTMRGIKHSLDSLAWHEGRKKGYLEYGSKTLELETVGPTKIWNKLTMANMFKMNLMTHTENFNRIVSAHAGQLYFAEATAKIRGERGMFNLGTNKNRMRRLMEDLWHLSREEINFMEKTKDFSAPESLEIHSAIQNKVGHFSHVSSQGGTSAIMLPLWMSSKEAKPFTLFQRMAMATTIDSYHNFVKPLVNHGNPMPILRASMAHAVSGYALWQIYDTFLGKEPPKGSVEGQNDGLNSLMLNLWRSEFLGVLGDVLSPYERELTLPISTPILLRNGADMVENVQQWWGQGKTGGQAIEDMVKRSIVVYNQYDVWKKKTTNRYFEDFNRLRAMSREFKKHRNMPQYTPEGLMSRRQPYYRDLKDSLMFGSEKDIAQAYWKAYDFIVTDMEQTNPYTTPQYRSKEAKKSIKNVVRHYDPLNIADEPTGTRMTLRKQFLKWLTPENASMAKEMEKIYNYRFRKYTGYINKPKWRNLYSVYPYI